MAFPFRGERLAVGREFAADPIRVGHEKGRAEPVRQVSIGRIVHIEHFLDVWQGGRCQDVENALAGEVCLDLKNLHAPSRRDHNARKLRLGRVGWSEGERHEFLATNFSDILRAGGREERSRHKHRQTNRQKGNCMHQRLHLNPPVEVHFGVCGYGLCAREQFFHRL